MSRQYYRSEGIPQAPREDIIHALAASLGAVPAFAVDTRPRLNPVLSTRPLRPGESLYIDVDDAAATATGPIRTRRYEAGRTEASVHIMNRPRRAH